MSLDIIGTFRLNLIDALKNLAFLTHHSSEERITHFAFRDIF